MYPQGTYPPTGGYPPQPTGYPPTGGYPPQPYPSQGFPPQGYPPTGYPPQYPPPTQGYPPQGGFPPPQGYPPQALPPQTGGYPAPPQPQQEARNQIWASAYYNQIAQNELAELQKWFRSVDRDNSGTITADELANVALGGIRLGIETSIKLLRIFDVDNNGSIDFREYAALHKFLLSMQSTFSAGDRDRDGRLNNQEIHNALQTGGFNMSYQTCQALYRKYNATGQGITMAEFVQLVAHVALCKTAFEFRDREKKGSIVMNFDQLLDFSALL